jgi:hypothetical protein
LVETVAKTVITEDAKMPRQLYQKSDSDLLITDDNVLLLRLSDGNNKVKKAHAAGSDVRC